MANLETLNLLGSVESLGDRIFGSRFADAMRNIMPAPIKRCVREFLRGEKIEYPLPEPVVVEMAGYQAKFKVNNYSDWCRVVAGDSEEGFGTELIETLAKLRGTGFLDVGSAQGIYSILAAVAGSRVIAVDPDPIGCNSLLKNIDLNPGVEDKILLLNLALSNEVGKTVLHTDNSGTYVPSLRKTISGLCDHVEVQTTTLDSLISEERVFYPDVVKIDVEGAEGLVLSGMDKLLSSSRKPQHLFIELHTRYSSLFGIDTQAVLDIITSYNYYPVKCWRRRGEILCHFAQSA